MSLLVIFTPTKRLSLYQVVWDSAMWRRIVNLGCAGIVLLIVLRYTHVISFWPYIRGLGLITGMNIYAILRGHYRTKRMIQLREEAVERTLRYLERKSQAERAREALG